MLKKLASKIPGVKRLARTLGLFPPPPPHSRHHVLEMLPKHSVGAEVGVHVGDFSAMILEVSHPANLHLIDPWRHESSVTYREALYGGRAKGGQAELDARYAGVCQRFRREIESGIVEVHRGDSAEVLTGFPDESLDWIYIDGNHLYEFVRRDLELAFAKVKPGGLITGDDYRGGSWWQGGVKRAVDEFAARANLVEVRNGQFIFRR